VNWLVDRHIFRELLAVFRELLGVLRERVFDNGNVILFERKDLRGNLRFSL
jgi:hypothetical protein